MHPRLERLYVERRQGRIEALHVAAQRDDDAARVAFAAHVEVETRIVGLLQRKVNKASALFRQAVVLCIACDADHKAKVLIAKEFESFAYCILIGPEPAGH